MEIIVKIEAPGLMEALLAIAEQMQTHNALQAGQPAPTGPVTAAPLEIVAPPVYAAPVAPPVAPVQPATVAPPVQPAPVVPAPVPTVVPPTYTQQDMAMACVQLMDLKGQPRIVEIMSQFGVQALTQLDKAQYNALAQVLRNEGVNI